MEHPVTIRSARISDLDEIFAVFSEVACRIPTDLSTTAHVEAMRQQIKESYFDGISLVAIDANGKIVGFQLALKQRWFETTYIKLAYAGVTAASENKGIFRRLIEAMKQHNIALVAEVKAANQSSMAARLEHYGFRHSGGANYNWHPVNM